MQAEANELAKAPVRGANGICGLYAVTPDLADTRVLSDQVRAALAGGCRLVQYRNKTADPGMAREQAAELRALTSLHGSLLIINDHAWLAYEVAADGVHLGKDDGGAAEIRLAREAAGSTAEFLVGVSCYNMIDYADRAVEAGADYVAFGSMFSSGTKPSATRASLALLAAAKQRCVVPVVAIGGISVANARSIIKAGADSIAVVSDLFESGDLRQITARARQFTSYFPDHV